MDSGSAPVKAETPFPVLKKADPAFLALIPPQKPDPSAVYRPSRYAVSVGGRVYNTLTQQCVQAILPDRAVVGEGYDDLIRQYFLVPEGKDECAFYLGVLSLIRALKRKKGCPAYTILPTYACNARCVYCYEEGRPAAHMAPETVEDVIRFILATHAPGTVGLHWFGGEPLLRADIIDRICLALRERGVPYVSGMVTNGSLVTPEMADKMAGLWNLRDIQVSMDGCRADHEARKRFKAPGDHYARIIGSVDLMSQKGIRVHVRCNVDAENLSGVGAFLEDLAAGIRHRDNVSVYLSPLNEARAGEGDVALWESILAFQDRIRQAGFGREGNHDGRLRTFHCMADRGDVVICPDGSLYACEHCPQEARFGDVRHNVTDPDGYRAFCETGMVREECRSCAYLPLCTPFAHCPVRDRHCREVKALTLAAYIASLGQPGEAEAPQSIC